MSGASGAAAVDAPGALPALTAPDVLDVVLDVREGDALDVVRRSRPVAREHTQAAFRALFDPRDAGGFSLGERAAVASFVVALHGETPLQAVYDAGLAAEHREVVAALAAAARRPGPYGVFREPGLAAESDPGERWEVPGDAAAQLGPHLAAALTHASLLVLRPRESRPEALAALLDAGWTREAVVTLSQLVAFLTFQVRIVAGLSVLKEAQP
ncbi:CMD domain protein [Litorihabitans aurantiacus]|uniref:CMD domain protein n=1 Tax=Litorihabitans aurantiacus TaxID=1930061 RepID=A0AA37UPR9_9MICO|nr:CMD domain protein [Litorihabitans aurantiacus]GMA30821.1 CMD domain protein [Litorihabitans aurantiacus]